MTPFQDPEVAAVAGAVLAQPSGILGRTEIVLGFPGGGLRRIARAGDAPAPTRGLSTVNAAARRDILNQLGGFSESTGIYGGEDSELFGRLTERYPAIFNPRALVYHRARDSIRGIAGWLYRRGISAIALLHLARSKRFQLVLRELRISLSVRLAVVTALLVSVEAPVLISLSMLAAIYYVVTLVRYRLRLAEDGTIRTLTHTDHEVVDGRIVRRRTHPRPFSLDIGSLRQQEPDAARP